MDGCVFSLGLTCLEGCYRGTAMISVMAGGNHKIEQLLSCRCDVGKQHREKIAFELCF